MSPCRGEVLVLTNTAGSLDNLVECLQLEGYRIDFADCLEDARQTFFASGGHGVLVIGPDVSPGDALRTSRTLLAVDDSLAVATFVAPSQQAMNRTQRGGPGQDTRPSSHRGLVTPHHPSSRAGQGALVRWLRAL